MTRNRLHLQFLSDTQIAQIEATAYRLLSEVGISLQHPKAREMLQGLGCTIEKSRVLIPRDVIQWTLSNITSHTTCRNRDGSKEFHMGDGVVRFHNSGGPPYTFDLESGQRRPAEMQDAIDAARVLDALPHVDVLTPLFGPQDIPAPIMALAATDATLRNTTKPFHAAAADCPEDVYFSLQMAYACCGGKEAFEKRPTMTFSVSPVSPLIFTEKVTGAIMAIAEAGAPFHSLPAPSLGATGPITMAGALAQQHAEVIASFTIAAAVRPGLPVLYCSRINPIDLRTAVSSWGGPEVGMSGACAAQLAHHIGVLCDSYGLCTSAGRLDPQFAYERFANAFTPALAGVDILSGVGGMESGLVGGLEIAVMDDEMIAIMKHIIAGCEVSDDTLAFDVMQEVIPKDGIFLSSMHTVQQMKRGAIWVPGVSERSAGSSEEYRGVIARARDKAQHILRTHQVEPLPENVVQQLDAVLEEARRKLLA